MDKVKAGLRGLNPFDKATRAAIVYSKMNGNAHFPNPEPSMAEFHAAYLELKQANLAALDRGRMAIFKRNRAVERIDDYLSRLASYVNSACQGDTLKLVSSGFFLVKRAEPNSSLEPPKLVTVRATAYPGQVKLRWPPVHGTRMYEVERMVEVVNGVERWERVASTSRTHLLVDDMPSHELQRFRVCALGTQTVSPYSAVAFGKAA